MKLGIVLLVAILCYFEKTSATLEAYSKVLVSTGRNGEDYPNDVEIIDLLSSDTTCQKPENFPEIGYSASGGLGFEEKPLICSGNCYFYDDRAWKMSNSFNQDRPYGAAMTKSPFQDDGSKLFVTGGLQTLFEPLSTTEVLAENGWQVSVPLPLTTAFHCMVTFNSTSVMVIGGQQGPELSGRSFFFNSETNRWTEGPTLNTARNFHSCGTIKKSSQSQDKSIIVVGGGDESIELSSVEVLDPDTNSWRNGPDLPFGISGAVIVEDPSGGVVLIGGGSQKDGDILTFDTLYRLPHAGSDATWELMPQKLTTPRIFHTAFLVPDEIAFCN